MCPETTAWPDDDGVGLHMDGQAHQGFELLLPLFEESSVGERAKHAVLPNVFRHAGVVPYKNWRGDAVELAAWILGGDFYLGASSVHNEMHTYRELGAGAVETWP